MYKISLWLLVILFWKESSGVLYNINDTEYDRMPKLYDLDDYDQCLYEPEALFCLVDGELNSESPSELFNLIRNYSDFNLKHYNHTIIHRGICVTKRCKSHLPNKRYLLTEKEVQENVLEACLNESIWKNYELLVTKVNVLYCNTNKKTVDIDGLDITVALIYCLIILSNIIGSFYDLHIKNRGTKGNPYLLSFSVFRNWTRLTAPSGVGPDPRLTRLKIFNGLRAMTMICVFFSHTALVMVFSYVKNPIYIEKAYDDPVKQILFNGTLVTYTFFTMSSFLLAFNFEIYSEKHKISWNQLPNGLIQRWLRLTPTYALIIATVCTWMRFLGDGPFWQQVVISESVACRQYWWSHLLYINNYVYDNAYCFPQSWYLAADTQLFCLGIAICIAARSVKARKITLTVLFILSLIIPAVQTYLEDLDPTVIQMPEHNRNLYAHYSTFRHLFVSGHANLSTYVIGLTGGFLAYRWQRDEKDFTKYMKYRWVYWSAFPCGVAVILSGGLFYTNGPRVHIAYRVLYAMFYKPLFQFLVLTLTMGAIFKYENVYRGVMEWRGWAWTGRVSYSGFLLHSLFQRSLIGSQRQATYLSDYYIMVILAATIFITFLTAAILWLTVEAPLNQLFKILMRPAKSPALAPKDVSMAKIESDTECNESRSKL